MLPTLSRLSVSNVPESRLRHRCSSQYLRISPLHWEFHSPPPYSSRAVSNAVPWLSHGIPHSTYAAAYAPFTPSNSEQRLPPPCYRGCWHGVSRGLFARYRQVLGVLLPKPSSRAKELYTPKGFITHAALLGQAFAHCPIFPTAASRRSLDRVSVPVWPFTLSGRLPILALVRRYRHQQANGTQAHLLVEALQRGPLWSKNHATLRHHAVLAPLSRCYPEPKGRLLTCYSPVRH